MGCTSTSAERQRDQRRESQHQSRRSVGSRRGRRAERIIARQLRIGRLQVGEAKAKEVLRAYDFNVPEGRACSTAEDAAELAEQVGYPVAMKISSPDVRPDDA